MTVSEFYDMVMLNENHRLRIKDSNDKEVDYITSVATLETSQFKENQIKHLYTDFDNKIYILCI